MTDATTPLASVPWLDPGMVDESRRSRTCIRSAISRRARPWRWRLSAGRRGALEAAKRLRDELDDGPPPLDPTTPLTLIEWFPERAVEHFKEAALDTLAGAAMAVDWDGTRVYPAWEGWRKLARRCRDEQGRWFRARDREDAHRKRESADVARAAARDARLDKIEAEIAAMRYGDPETKRQAWLQSTDHYGVKPHVVQQGIDEQETHARLNEALNDPADALHEHAVALVNQDWAARQVGGYEQHVGQYEQQIDGFARATDDKGNLAHPHFAEVYEDMVGIAEATTARGKQPDLQTVYRQALLENPRLRQAEQVRRARQGAGMLSGSGGADTGHRGDTGDDLDSIIRSQVG